MSYGFKGKIDIIENSSEQAFGENYLKRQKHVVIEDLADKFQTQKNDLSTILKSLCEIWN